MKHIWPMIKAYSLFGDHCIRLSNILDATLYYENVAKFVTVQYIGHYEYYSLFKFMSSTCSSAWAFDILIAEFDIHSDMEMYLMMS